MPNIHLQIFVTFLSFLHYAFAPLSPPLIAAKLKKTHPIIILNFHIMYLYTMHILCAFGIIYIVCICPYFPLFCLFYLSLSTTILSPPDRTKSHSSIHHQVSGRHLPALFQDPVTFQPNSQLAAVTPKTLFQPFVITKNSPYSLITCHHIHTYSDTVPPFIKHETLFPNKVPSFFSNNNYIHASLIHRPSFIFTSSIDLTTITIIFGDVDTLICFKYKIHYCPEVLSPYQAHKPFEFSHSHMVCSLLTLIHYHLPLLL